MKSWLREDGSVELVASLGPASLHCVSAIVEAGATILRLNASHMATDELRATVARIRGAMPDVRIVVDLQGAKMRLGEFGPRQLTAGDSVTFSLGTHGDSAGSVPVPHVELLRAIHTGDVIRCDDDRIRFEVTEVRERGWSARCQHDGLLKPRKAINLLEHPVAIDALSSADVGHMEALKDFDGLAFAFSFMTDGREAAWLRERAAGTTVIGKVERRHAVEHIADISGQVDLTWICRGDLGAQLGSAELARFIAAFRPDAHSVPSWMAGQVLEHLTTQTWCTRTEVCHLYDLLARGYTGIVLSDETAIGVDPVAAVRKAATLLRQLNER